MAYDQIKSALAGLPLSMQRRVQRPIAPSVPAAQPMLRPASSRDQFPIQNLPSSQPIPRPQPAMPGQNAYQPYRPQPIQQQPIFQPFPRPINPPGQRPDMHAGGSPNFDEMTGQYKPQALPNVQDAFQRAYQQYRPQPIPQQMNQQPMNEMQQQLQHSQPQSYQPNPNALAIGPGGQRMTVRQLQELQRQNAGQFKPVMG